MCRTTLDASNIGFYDLWRISTRLLQSMTLYWTRITRLSMSRRKSLDVPCVTIGFFCGCLQREQVHGGSFRGPVELWGWTVMVSRVAEYFVVYACLVMS